MPSAGKIVSNECLTSRASPFLIVTGLDFNAARKHEHDLARRRVMPALIKSGRQLNKTHRRRWPGIRLFKYSTCGTRPRLVYWHFDFMESGSTIFCGVEPD